MQRFEDAASSKCATDPALHYSYRDINHVVAVEESSLRDDESNLLDIDNGESAFLRGNSSGDSRSSEFADVVAAAAEGALESVENGSVEQANFGCVLRIAIGSLINRDQLQWAKAISTGFAFSCLDVALAGGALAVAGTAAGKLQVLPELFERCAVDVHGDSEEVILRKILAKCSPRIKDFIKKVLVFHFVTRQCGSGGSGLTFDTAYIRGNRQQNDKM